MDLCHALKVIEPIGTPFVIVTVMNILTRKQNIPKLEIIRVNYELRARGALQLADTLYSSLDNGERYKIIDLADVTEADGMWIKIMEYFTKRGLWLRLFNVGLDIQNLLTLSGKNKIIKTINSQDINEAVYLFEEEIMNEDYNSMDSVMGRLYPRIATHFQTEFIITGHPDGEIQCKANVLNLSEEGLHAVLILSFNTKTGQIVKTPDMVNMELSDIHFELNGFPIQISTEGRCVWKTDKDEKTYIGIQFKNMKQVYTETITDYVLAEFTKANIQKGYHVKRRSVMCLS